MSDLTTLTRRFYDEVLGQGKLELIDEYVDPKFVEHEETPPGVPEGRDGLIEWVKLLRRAFPDITARVQDIVQNEDDVWARVTFTGTHQGEFLGIPPTGRSFEITAMDCLRYQDGKATEHWGVTDTVSMLMQLGVLDGPMG